MSVTRVRKTSPGRPPIGIEMQRTIWGYRRAGALGNTIFASTILINKSGAKIDSMYLVQWADPDLGDAGDDYAGCDTTRSLGYIYNGKADATYGTAVPAGGFDFFQGPDCARCCDRSGNLQTEISQGIQEPPDVGICVLHSGYRCICRSYPGCRWRYPVVPPDEGDGREVRVPTSSIPTTNKTTKFCFAGDPVKATGWNDGGAIPAADRRICLVTGPFTMAVGDTQELVVANLAGIGADRLSSVSAMKVVDDLAQQAYNGLFVLPSPPPHLLFRQQQWTARSS